MAKLIRMKTTYAGPDTMLDAGKVYKVSDELYARLKKGNSEGSTVFEDVKKETLSPKKRSDKILSVPAQPDPESVDVKEDEEITEDDDE